MKKYWRGYSAEPKWRTPELLIDSVIFSTPRWNYIIPLPKVLVRTRSKKMSIKERRGR